MATAHSRNYIEGLRVLKRNLGLHSDPGEKSYWPSRGCPGRDPRPGMIGGAGGRGPYAMYAPDLYHEGQ